MELRIDVLHEDSPLLEMVLRWHWHEWSAGHDDADLDEWRARLRTRTLPDGIPFTLVAHADHEPVGCLSVCDDDGDARFPDQGPWLSGMLVVGPGRNLGIGRSLLERAAERAKVFDVAELWLHTGEASAFYQRCGWQLAHRKEHLGDDAVLWRAL